MIIMKPAMLRVTKVVEIVIAERMLSASCRSEQFAIQSGEIGGRPVVPFRGAPIEESTDVAVASAAPAIALSRKYATNGG